MAASDSDPICLFVYGSLRSGGSAAGYLSGCSPIGTFRIPGSLYDLDGDYPALVLDEAGEVEGEVWRCPTELLTLLDRYELVHEGMYERARVRVGEHDCWTYVAGPALAALLVPERRIASGTWPPRTG